MTQAGLSKNLIVSKINETEGVYDTSAKSSIELKKAGVSDEVIKQMTDADSETAEQNYSDSDTVTNDLKDSIYVARVYKSSDDNSRIVLDPSEALKNAKTIAIKSPHSILQGKRRKKNCSNAKIAKI